MIPAHIVEKIKEVWPKLLARENLCPCCLQKKTEGQ